MRFDGPPRAVPPPPLVLLLLAQVAPLCGALLAATSARDLQTSHPEGAPLAPKRSDLEPRALWADQAHPDPWKWLSNKSHDDERPIKKAKASHEDPKQLHMVQHIELLNKKGFWVLMAVVILCIAVTVVKMELQIKEDSSEAPAAGAGRGLPGASPSHAGSAQGKFTLSWVAHLLFCVVGLNTSMLFWGVAQEFMMTSLYARSDGQLEHIPSALFLVLCNRALAVIVTAGIIALSPRLSFTFTGQWACGLPAASNLVASWCQYQSLAYVSFPIQTAAKSAKLLPVVVLGSLRGKQQTILDYAEAILIVFALAVFGFETDSGDSPMTAQGLGVLLLCGLVFFDSMTPHLQDGLFKHNPDLSMVQATFSMGIFSTLMALFSLTVSGFFMASIRFLAHHPEAVVHVVVLSLCSTLTQFLISYTIKHFGPITFALISTTRQLISVCLSAVLFKHHITLLAWLAAAVVFGTVIGRAVRPRDRDDGDASDRISSSGPYSERSLSLVETLAHHSSNWKLLICAMGIHVPLMFYSVAQEFMSTHTFKGQLFKYPLFIIVVNRAVASLLAVVVLKLQGLPVLDRQMWLTVLPAAANLGATFCQYEALFFLRYPAQTLLKSVKVLPVMFCGRLLRNRSYSWLDYAEGLLITSLVCVFMYSFHNGKENLQPGAGMIPGVLLMIGYLFADSFTSNAEDVIYQRVNLDPGQMLLGMQAFAGLAGGTMLLLSGQVTPALRFLFSHRQAALHLMVLVLAEACGAYACTVTVRLFGPAVFTLLLMSHQVVSLVISVALFKHQLDWASCLCLGVVTLVILTSSLRRVRAQRLEKPGMISK